MSRYIDADIFFQKACERFDYVDDFMEVLEDTPTADVRENVHGEWDIDNIGEGVLLCCSECAYHLSLIGPVEDRINELNYCPNCGADMRGDKQ